MSRLMLVAASGLAREVLAVERTLNRFTQFRVVDDDQARWGSALDGESIVGGLDQVVEYDDHQVLVCAGRGPTRRRIVDRLRGLGVSDDRFTTMIHPRSEVPPGCAVGRGSIVLAGVVMTARVDVGSHVVVMPHVTLTHDDVVDDYATLCAGVSVGGGARIRSGAYLGMNASVREGATVGVDGMLGMGAVLLQDLPPGETWVGVPARPLLEPVAASGRDVTKERS